MSQRSAALLFTDLAGFPSAGLGTLIPSSPLLDDLRGILRARFREYRGREARTVGDAFLVEFPGPFEAVGCAIAIQETLHVINAERQGGRNLLLQIGVHVGPVVRSGWDITGEAVDVVSWIQPLSEPGGVCVSSEVFERVRFRLDRPMERLVTQVFQHVPVAVEVFKVVLPWEGQAPSSSPMPVAETEEALVPEPVAGPGDPASEPEPFAAAVASTSTVEAVTAGADELEPAGAQPDLLSPLVRPTGTHSSGTESWDVPPGPTPLQRAAIAWGTPALAAIILGLPTAEFLTHTLTYHELLHRLLTIFPLVAVIGAAQVALSLALRS